MSRILQISSAAHNKIRRAYEDTGVTDLRVMRPYHSWWHTEGVCRRLVALITEINEAAPGTISPEAAEAAEAAALGHDVDQTCVYVEGPNGTMRKRLSGVIEGASASWLLRDTDARAFDAEQQLIVADAIMATVPAWDGVKNRLIQPNLRSGSRLTSVLLALADLGSGVMEGTKSCNEGMMVFIEDYVYVLDALVKGGSFLADNAPGFAQTIVQYLAAQGQFHMAVAARLEEEMLPLVPEVARDPIRNLCSRTDEAREAAERVHFRASQLAEQGRYIDLFRFMGYYEIYPLPVG